MEAGSRVITFEATVSGLGEFPVSGRATINYHAGEVYAGLQPQNYIVDAGNEITTEVVTVDWSGKPVANQNVEVVYYLRDWWQPSPTAAGVNR
ncbi:MAG: hypothetical protein DCC51_07645 [Anaerolineae bacterium]|nr:MAG: hypothetical protein DCC51_07645 [Anaerolineae bacterium]